MASGWALRPTGSRAGTRTSSTPTTSRKTSRSVDCCRPVWSVPGSPMWRSSAPATGSGSTSTPRVPGSSSGAAAPRPTAIRADLEKLTKKQVQLNILEVKNPESVAQLVGPGGRRAVEQPRGVPPGDAQGHPVCNAPTQREGHPGAVLPARLGGAEMRPLGVLPRGPRSAAHPARRHRLRPVRGPRPPSAGSV